MRHRPQRALRELQQRLDPRELQTTIQTSQGNGNAWLNSVTVPGNGQSGNGYTVTAVSTNGDTYSITRTDTGQVTRQCTNAGAQTVCVGRSWSTRARRHASRGEAVADA